MPQPFTLLASVLEHLAGLEPAALAQIVALRPDAAREPRPVTLHQLAVRLCEAGPIAELLAGLDSACTQVATAVQQATGRVPAPGYYTHDGGGPLSAVCVVEQAEVQDLLAIAPGDDGHQRHAEVLKQLAERVLVWPVGGGLAVHPGLDELARLRRRRGEPMAQLPPLPLHCPLPDTTPVMPAERLLPEATTALAVTVEQVQALLSHLEGDPLPVVKKSGGGLAVPTIRNLAEHIACPVEQMRLLLHLVVAARLVVAKTTARYDQSEWLHIDTDPCTAWQAASPADKAGQLIGAWARLRALPGGPPAPLYRHRHRHRHRPTARTPTLLSREDLGFEAAPAIRRAVLNTLTLLPPGQAATSTADLAALVRWHRPRWFLPNPPPPGVYSSLDFDDRVDLDLVLDGVLAEAQALGLTVRGALSPLGRVLLSDGQDAVAALAATVLTVTGTVKVQSDHTLVAIGIPAPELSALIDQIADLETVATHTRVWRLSTTRLQRYLAAGDDAETLLEQLRAVAPDGLPQPVEYLITDLGRKRRPVAVTAGTCLRAGR
ncbi:helicase-associated domain-containing protein [Nonomuraea sp. NPDC050556]|uniref:helicase-associated domain-containing protein n=1 Tax=Nonomuraea sp. NPDC050556 TaxID=3364369 RepID=UPI0037A18579